MSSSSSDSDSDEIEPIRRLKINIKPKDHVARKEGADVEAIKASVEAWRPLGPRPHPSLTRRQSSLSSMSSLSFGGTGSIQGGLNSTTATPNSVASATACQQYNYQTMGANAASGAGLGVGGGSGVGSVADGANKGIDGATTAPPKSIPANFMRSSPSCSSLVNEFSSRASFSNFMSNASRTSSPLTFMSGNGVGGGAGANYCETSVPIALAIQESIELTVRGQQGQPVGELKTRFETRALGNIKVAFPNSFARLCSAGAPSDKPIPALKLRLHSTENIVRYYASGLVKDLESESSSLASSMNPEPLSATTTTTNTNTAAANNNNNNTVNTSTSLDTTSCSTSTNGSERNETTESNYDLFDMNESPAKRGGSTKIIEFDMDALVGQLKQLYDQAPSSRYFNVDVLRYQIAPLAKFETCPLQVCAYWKVEPKLVKLRVDFKHSSLSGLPLERLREVSFCADLGNLVPSTLTVQPVPPSLVSTLARNQAKIVTASHQTGPGSSSSSTSTASNRDSFRNLSSNSSDSSLLGDYNRNVQGNLTAAVPSAAALLPNQQHQCRINSGVTVQPANGLSQVPLLSAMPPQPAPRQINSAKGNSSISQIRLPPPPSSGHSRNLHQHQQQQHHLHNALSQASNLNNGQVTGMDTLRKQPSPFLRNQSNSSSSGRSDNHSLASGPSNHDKSLLDQLLSLDEPKNVAVSGPSTSTVLEQTLVNRQQTPPAAAPAIAVLPSVPYITFEPQAHWNDQTKQLVWRFDNLLSYYKNDGYGSLLAKLDFRQSDLAATANVVAATLDKASPAAVRESPTPRPIDIKFMVVDSTLSKVNLTIESSGYRMSLLKKEIRSGRYKSEPYIF